MARTEKQNGKGQSTKGARKAAPSSGSSKKDTPNSSYVSKASEPASTNSKGQPGRSASASGDGSGGRLRRAASKVRNVLSKARSLVSRRNRTSELAASAAPETSATPRGKTDRPTSVRVHRESDIPMEQLEQTYTPHQTSLKSGFRFDGSERQRDQEFANGAGDERWNDEDRVTNKSNDPRIGTHGRTYEPGERFASPDDTK